jgi:hypothetical protein
LTHRDIHGRPEVPQPLRILETPMPFDNAHPVGSRLSPEALMSNHVHMTSWILDNFEPTDFVCGATADCDACLGATFLRAMGFEDAIWYCHSGRVDGRVVSIDPFDRVARAISRLYIADKRAPVTAARALEALGA